MFLALAITLRECLEAFVIVAVTLAFLRQTGALPLISAVYWGMAVSVVTSLIGAWLYSSADNQSLWEGVLALIAAAAVAVLLHRVRRAARAGAEGGPSATLGGGAAWLGMFLFVVLMISRKGIGTMLLIGTLIFQVRAVDLVGGAVAGVVLAALVAWSWSRYGRRVNRRVYFQVTGVFLVILLAQLAVTAVHEVSEGGAFAGGEALHDASAPFSADGRYGQYSTDVLIAAPLAWLAVALFLGYGKASTGRVAHVDK